MPNSVVLEIIKMQRNFFWSHDGIRRGIALIKWENIQKPKEQGGLGVGDLMIRNAALLFKWWWRYSCEDKPLWKQVINSIHGQQSYAMNQKIKNTGGPWQGIHQILTSNDEFCRITEKGFRWKVGAGDRVKFWEDVWCGEICLKDEFQRLYSMSLQKNTLIKDMRVWDGVQWGWTFLWRRELRQWECEELERLRNRIQEEYLNENADDTLWWDLDDKGQFSSRTFNRVVWNARGRNEQQTEILAKCWQRIAPLRVEILVWIAMQGRLNTKERLVKIGCLDQQANVCAICGEMNETTQHLFISCSLASRLWQEAKGWWKTTYILPGDLLTVFDSWMQVKGVGTNIGRKGWKILFFVIIDCIWNARNLSMFEGRKRSFDTECTWMKLRTVLWLKAVNPEISYSPSELVNNVEAIKSWRNGRKIK